VSLVNATGNSKGRFLTDKEEYERTIASLESHGILKRKEVLRAFLSVPRWEFLPRDAKGYAHIDTPIPIGHGQTTSALHMTAMFCEYGGMKLGQKVLEVGGGCGYMSCVYAEVVAPKDAKQDQWGHVWSVEIVKELAESAKQSIERTGYGDRVTMIYGDASEGLPEHAPYNVIVVTSAAPDVPKPMIEQLAPNGVLLIPIGGPHLYQELLRIGKSDGGIEEESIGGVAFVPMRGKRGWKG
jgi:protein-L-isoaspartate(D-aspartate) O-methyltransferase